MMDKVLKRNLQAVVDSLMEVEEGHEEYLEILKPAIEHLSQKRPEVKGVIYPVIEKVVLRLSYEQGQSIKEMIREYYPHTFPAYCTKVGVRTPNFYPVMSGEKSCTLEFLQRVLSGIHHEVELSDTGLLISESMSGVNVKPADYTELDEE